jgi:hypothetical protein
LPHIVQRSHYGCGGACDIGAAKLRLCRCCGLSCRADDQGQFLSLDDSGAIAGAGVDSHAVSELTVLQCGTKGADSWDATLYVESAVAAAFREVNVTECAVYCDGGALYAVSGSEPYSLTFFVAERCDYSDSIVANGRSGFPTIDYANFYGNTPYWYLLYGNSKGMKLRNCIFVAGNTKPLVYTDSQKFDLDYCYDSGAAPSSSYASVGANCVPNTRVHGLCDQHWRLPRCSDGDAVAAADSDGVGRADARAFPDRDRGGEPSAFSRLFTVQHRDSNRVAIVRLRPLCEVIRFGLLREIECAPRLDRLTPDGGL